MSSTLLAISRAVDGVRGWLFNPSYLRLPCASIGYSGLALRQACEELGLPQRCCALAVTMEEDGALEHSLAFAGIAKNSAGGIYKNGATKPFEEKARVAQMWIDMTGANPHNNQPLIRTLANAAKVSRKFAGKVVAELREGLLVNPKTMVKSIPRGKGSISISDKDGLVLLRMQQENNQRILHDYRQGLYQATSKLVSWPTICQWFLKTNRIKGNVRKLNQVPVDKLKPDNVLHAVEYTELIDMLPTINIKFADKKHLKGQEIFNRYGRRCPLTGELEPVIVGPDFRNSHTIIGCCGIAPDAPPFYFWMHYGTNDAFTFSEFVYSIIVDGFLRNGDVLMIDNASIHRCRDLAVLEEILWEDYKILLIFMPGRSPELNPIELMWNILVQCLRRVSMTGRHTLERNALAGKDIMDTFTHSKVASCYQKCSYI